MLRLYKILIYLLILILSSQSGNAQIIIATTNASSCNKADGKASITVKTSETGFNFEYAVDGGAFQASGDFTGLDEGEHTGTVRDKNTKCSFSKKFTIKGSLSVSVSASAFYGGCNDHGIITKPRGVTLTAIVVGGSGNYSYLWMSGESTQSITLNPGGPAIVKYSVNVTDKVTGCKQNLSGYIIVIPVICALDPNDIVGPAGYGPGKMVSKFQPQPYSIHFENDSSFATAPAQIVKIVQPLDSTVNIYSLRLGNFGFGKRDFQVPPDKTYYSKRLDVLDSLGIVVDVTAGIDVERKEVFWIFESKDPNTGLPPSNALLGFLPVNDSSSKGEGSVSYTIKPGNQTQTGDTIHAQASIIFDQNAPLATPKIFNTIDAVAPVSKIKFLAIRDTNTIVLRWSGIDDTKGSGVRDYALYVSENGGPFSLYQSGIADTTITFEGTPGNTYCFYTIATDNVNNKEPVKSGCEGLISLPGGGPLPITWLYFNGSEKAKDVVLNWATTSEMNSKFFAIERSFNGVSFTQVGTIQAIGNSILTNNYTYNDKDAMALPYEILYYRLRQVDNDGKFIYSIVISIRVSHNINEPVISAYPNPFRQNITLKIITVTPTDQTDNVVLYTIDGRVLYRKEVIKRGNATILLDDIPTLAQGIYLLRISIKGRLYTMRMIRN